MWRKLALFTTVVLCARAQNGISNATSGPWTAELNGTWRWHVGDDLRWAAPSYDDSSWQSLSIPGPAPNARHYWIRIPVLLGKVTDPGIMIGGIAYAYDVYWDGRRIGSFGEASRGIWFVPRLQTFHLARDLTKPGAHAIAIRIAQIGPGIGIASRQPMILAGDNRVGELPALQESESSRMSADFQPRLLQLLAAFGFFLAALYFFLLPPSVSEGAAFRWLGVILLGRALNVGCELYWNFGPLDVPGNVLVWAWAFVALSVVGMVEFPYALFRRQVPMGVHCIECFLAFFFAAPKPISYSALTLRFALFLIPAAVGIGLVTAELRKRTAGAGFALVLFGIFGLTALNSVLAVGYHIGVPYAVYIGGFWLWSWDAMYLLWVPAITMQIHKANLRFRDERERLRGEMEAARQVQELLLPSQAIQTPGFEIDASYHPATEVGGDFFQIFPAAKGSLLIVIGDVSGKGMKAALLVSLIVGALRNRRSNQPSCVLNELNAVLLGPSEGGFTTCCCALFASDGTVTLANAGHLAPYRNGREIATPPGVPLGLTLAAGWEETQVELHPGDRLLWLSDGVIEARNGKRELLGFERAQELADQPAAEISRAAQAFGQEDDITVISITRQRAAAYVA